VSSKPEEPEQQRKSSPGPEQVPSPEQGDRPRSEREPSDPTATAPESVQESVYEQAQYAGKEGTDAADPPIAKRKAAGTGEPPSDDDTDTHPTETDTAGKNSAASGPADTSSADTDSADTDPGEDLDPDEAADAFETPEQAADAKGGKDEQRRDEDIISLDGSD